MVIFHSYVSLQEGMEIVGGLWVQVEASRIQQLPAGSPKIPGHGRDAPGAHAAQRQLQSIWEIHRAAVWIPSRVDLSHVTCGFFFVLIWS